MCAPLADVLNFSKVDGLAVFPLVVEPPSLIPHPDWYLYVSRWSCMKRSMGNSESLMSPENFALRVGPNSSATFAAISVTLRSLCIASSRIRGTVLFPVNCTGGVAAEFSWMTVRCVMATFIPSTPSVCTWPLIFTARMSAMMPLPPMLLQFNIRLRPTLLPSLSKYGTFSASAKFLAPKSPMRLLASSMLVREQLACIISAICPATVSLRKLLERCKEPSVVLVV